MLFALSRIIGDGRDVTNPREVPLPQGAYRPAAERYGSYLVLIGGHTFGGWSLVLCGPDFDAVAADADPDVRMLPEYPLDYQLSKQEANLVNVRLSHFGLEPYATNRMTVRELLGWLRDQIDPTWDFEAARISL